VENEKLLLEGEIHVDLSEIPLLEGVQQPKKLKKSFGGSQQPNKLSKTLGNALSSALIMSHFQNFGMTPSNKKTVLRAVLINKLIRNNLGP